MAFIDHDRRALLWTDDRVCDDGSAGTGDCSGQPAIAVLARRRPTGAFTQPAGRDGCVTRNGSEGCARGNLGFDISPGRIVVNPGADTSYLFNDSGPMLTLSTHPASSGLRLVHNGDDSGTALAFSRNGALAYLAHGTTIAVETPSAATGVLTLAAQSPCITIPAGAACNSDWRIGSLLVSASGRDAYTIEKSFDTDAVAILHQTQPDRRAMSTRP
jgi:hypothetical protein